MKITIESTSRMVTLVYGHSDFPARVWEGTSEGGVPVVAFVTRIAVPEGMDQEQFQKELSEQRVPSASLKP